ncbi:MAG: hypothetical protein ACREJX_21065, partial [Polyangiaceae bacterium]
GTQLVATYLLIKGGGTPWLVAGYMVIVSAISFISLISMRKFYMNIPSDKTTERLESAIGAG